MGRGGRRLGVSCRRRVPAALRTSEYGVTSASARDWWENDIGGRCVPGRPPLRSFFAKVLTPRQLKAYISLFRAQLDSRTITFSSACVSLWGAEPIRS